MKLKDLIGKTIKDIKTEINDFDYDGSIPLEQSNSCIVLDSGETFEIPYNHTDDLELEQSTIENQTSIFAETTTGSFFSRIFKSAFRSQQWKVWNTENLKGKKIVGIYQYDDGCSEKRRDWDKCILEVETGFLISEVVMSPVGTGHAGIWIFTSKSDLIDKIGAGVRQIY